MSESAIPFDSKAKADAATAALKAQEQRLKVERLKGTLVDRGKVIAHVQKLAQEERTAFAEFIERQGGRIVDEMGVDPEPLFELLEGALQEFLAQRSAVKVEIAADV